MTREIKSGAEIWHQMRYLLGTSISGTAGRLVQVPLPEKLERPDASGCNWTLQVRQSAADQALRISAIVEAARARWNMR